MSGDKTRGPAVVNQDLAAVHSALVRLVSQLDDSIANATTSAQVIAITNEIAEVNTRVASLGRQLLVQQTDAIKHQSDAVLRAIPAVENAIQSIEDLQKFVVGTTTFLQLVDKAVGLAKVVG